MNLELDKILGQITGSLVDENIVPHDKYEDAVTDEDIVLLGQQLLDDAKFEIRQLIQQEIAKAKKEAYQNGLITGAMPESIGRPMAEEYFAELSQTLKESKEE